MVEPWSPVNLHVRLSTVISVLEYSGNWSTSTEYSEYIFGKRVVANSMNITSTDYQTRNRRVQRERRNIGFIPAL